MIIHRAHARQQGFSMLEVLIAVLVFSLGMIGLAGLLIFAISSNHVAYLRTQATFLAHGMAARMGANPAGVWAGDYNINAILAPGTAITTTCAAGCNPADLATHDIQAWSQQVNTFLPSAQGTITCSTAGLGYVPTPAQQDMRPPYGGKCTMRLWWNEAKSADGTKQLHSFEWIFQP